MFGLFNRKKGKPGLLGLSLIDKELALAYVGSTAGEPALLACELQAVSSFAEAGKLLADKVRSLGLEQTRCNFVLAPDDYSLLLVEAPNVEAAELAAAAKWKIKDMIDRPLEQVAISVFPVPHDAYRNQRDMLYVVAADRKKIQQVVDLVTNAGLQLGSIDIPELAMRNLTTLYTDDSNGLATMDLRHDGSLLNLSRNGSIYLTRHLSTQIGDEILRSHEWENVKDRLVLEIQRSLDYYESQYDQSPIGDLVIAPANEQARSLANALESETSLRIHVLDVREIMAVYKAGEFATDWQSLLALGAALRTDTAGE